MSLATPTLPHSFGCSTIGAERLNGRVRDENGCFPFAMVARDTLYVTSHKYPLSTLQKKLPEVMS